MAAAAAAFQLWKDYFQLAKVIEEIGWKRNQDDDLEGALVLTKQKSDSIRQPSVQRSGEKEPLVCTFCKHNGESKRIYASHPLKDEAGRVQCPILRNYTCPQCGASKDAAHTKRYCPLTKKGYTSVYRSCIRNSAGKKSRFKSAAEVEDLQRC